MACGGGSTIPLHEMANDPLGKPIDVDVFMTKPTSNQVVTRNVSFRVSNGVVPIVVEKAQSSISSGYVFKAYAQSGSLQECQSLLRARAADFQKSPRPGSDVAYYCATLQHGQTKSVETVFQQTS
jgi:hypothetical protein